MNDINLALSFILVINNTYVNINIGAKRIRDTGCKAIYFVLISLGLTLFSYYLCSN
ncbi:putative membrane protein [Escherichia coli DEC5C]|nr:putative membrane protein [Escherichia coli DEC5C]